MATAWYLQSKHGAMINDDYPYTSGNTSKETRCAHNSDKTIGKVTKLGQIDTSGGIEGVKEKLKTHPITIAIDAGGSIFQYYKEGGISADAGCGTGLNHAVVLVGYTDGESDDKPNPEPPTPEPTGDCT